MQPPLSTLTDWKPKDRSRPRPPVVTPGVANDVEFCCPSDARLLFDGTSLEAWMHPDGRAAEWTLVDGTMRVRPGKGDVQTKAEFGDIQLHLEWKTPESIEGDDQLPGNSGLFLMGLYEIQILESYENDTYPDGQAAAIYGQYPPLVNACRPPGEWQTFDLVFRAPRFEPDGALAAPAVLTLFHNGILVHDSVELTGPTGKGDRPPYAPHAPKLPIRLQDHGSDVAFRRIWVREL